MLYPDSFQVNNLVKERKFIMNKKKSNFKEECVSENKSETPRNNKPTSRNNRKTKGARTPSAPNNDSQWYTVSTQLLNDVASFPFYYPVGSRFDFGPYGGLKGEGDSGTVTKYGLNDESLPGVCALYFRPTIGYSDNSTSAVNIAARNMYSFIRHANSGHANYDAPDLMMYIIAMSSVHSYIEWVRRLVASMTTSSYVNRYLPRSLVWASGFDYDDFAGKLADLRAFLNTYITRAGSLCVPANIKYYQKHKWLYSSVYLDSPAPKSQMYVFVPKAFYAYTLMGTTGNERPFLIQRDVDPRTRLTLDDLIQLGEDLLEPILKSETMNIMSGDILKAYGPEGVAKIDMCETTPMLPVGYNQTVLNQIQNAYVIGDTQLDKLSMAVSENANSDGDVTGWLTSTPYSKPTGVGIGDIGNSNYMNRILNVEGGHDPATVIDATRWSVIATERKTDDSTYAEWRNVGSEICVGMDIYRWQTSPTGTAWMCADFELKSEFRMFLDEFTPDVIAPEIATYMDQLCQVSQFNRHPFVYPVMELRDNTGKAYFSTVTGWLGDTNDYTIITADNLQRMADAALLAMFDVTQYGRR